MFILLLPLPFYIQKYKKSVYFDDYRMHKKADALENKCIQVINIMMILEALRRLLII
jgi:hypothetical protein